MCVDKLHIPGLIAGSKKRVLYASVLVGKAIPNETVVSRPDILKIW